MSEPQEKPNGREQEPLYQASLLLYGLLESATPAHDWETQLGNAQAHIRTGMETSNVPDRYRAEMLLISSPLFAIRALRHTMSKSALRTSYEDIQHGYIGLIHRIDRSTRVQSLRLQVGELVGLANEAVFLAAGTAPDRILESDSIVLPALSWQDDVSQPTPRGIGIHTRTPSIDLTSVDLQDGRQKHFQVKSSHKTSNLNLKDLSQYEKHGIPILYCDRIMEAVTGIYSRKLFSIATMKDRNVRARQFAAVCQIIDDTYPVSEGFSQQEALTVNLGSLLRSRFAGEASTTTPLAG